MGQHAFGHDFGGAQRIPAMHQMHHGAEPGQVGGLLTGGIAAAHDDERLVAEHRQGAVTSGAIGDPLGLQQILARHAQMPVAGTGGDDDSFGRDGFTIHIEGKGAPGKIHRLHGAKTRPGAKALGLFLHAGHQFVAVHPFGETGLASGEHEGGQIGPGRVERRRPTGAARTNDDNFFHKGRKHRRRAHRRQALGKAAAKRSKTKTQNSKTNDQAPAREAMHRPSTHYLAAVAGAGSGVNSTPR